jgi:hypothetical protein
MLVAAVGDAHAHAEALEAVIEAAQVSALGRSARRIYEPVTEQPHHGFAMAMHRRYAD